MAILKRLAAPKWWPIERKASKFVVSPRGPHPKEFSLPLLVFIRDVLKVAENSKEAKSIIKRGEILIDGRKMKDYKYGIGLFDVIEIPALKKVWRAVPFKKGLKFLEIPENEKMLKICKIINKKTLKKGRIQINLHDGRNVLSNEKYSTHDSLLIELPEQKIKEHIKLEPNSLVLVTGGSNIGKMARVSKIEENRVWLKDEKEIEVPKKFVIVIGKDKPLIKVVE